MIELRWLVVDDPIRRGSLLATVLLDDPLWQVLQMRQMTNPLEIGLQDPVWTEWKDVPVVGGKYQPTEEQFQ